MNAWMLAASALGAVWVIVGLAACVLLLVVAANDRKDRRR